MPFDPGFTVGEEVGYERLTEIFKCSDQGGMRRSLKTNTLVLIANHIKSLYEDRWVDNNLIHYTGMGQLGDQDLNRSQNRTLNESGHNNVDLHFFEQFTKAAYTYRGRVRLDGPPFESQQPDANGELRRVWVFPLRMISDGDFYLEQETQREIAADRERGLIGLSIQELRERARHANKRPSLRDTKTKTYIRDPSVSVLAKKRASGVCQLCGGNAPFINSEGEPYLETHHIIWLSKGGEDTPENTVALCPNCHRKMHSLNLESDRVALLEAAGN